MRYRQSGHSELPGDGCPTQEDPYRRNAPRDLWVIPLLVMSTTHESDITLGPHSRVKTSVQDGVVSLAQRGISLSPARDIGDAVVRFTHAKLRGVMPAHKGD